MDTFKNNSKKCEFCEQNFNDKDLTTTFNRIYNHICKKCEDYLKNRGDVTGYCSKYCIESGKCDGSC